MTKKRCTDCKYTEGIGYDFWCGEGHTEYEVFGAETNCPYYEYHDWSKGTPSMTEKRFILTERKCYFTSLIFDTQENEKMGSDKAMECLNTLHEENQALKLRLEFIEAHNKALIHTNDELKKDLRKYDKLLELEYWREK